MHIRSLEATTLGWLVQRPLSSKGIFDAFSRGCGRGLQMLAPVIQLQHFTHLVVFQGFLDRAILLPSYDHLLITIGCG
ncbi:hypothetical protein XI06_09245 [Bradyrhizobium sp. CCBAU 11434]|nr:hypothetical protein [Bradyrhizobium sp. CCBAU 11434]